MNEVENFLREDGVEKRSAGRAAYTKGKSHRGCTLPCDNASKKELKQLNGEVVEMNIKKPMSWNSFKKMPKDLQEEYLVFLHNEFGATLTDIGLKFGLSGRTSFWRWCKAQGLDTSKFCSRGRKSNLDQRWEKFWEDDSEVTTAVSVPVLEHVAEQKEEDSAKVSSEDDGCTIRSFTISLTNISSWDDAVALLKLLPLPKYNVVSIDLYSNSRLSLSNDHGRVRVCKEAL